MFVNSFQTYTPRHSNVIKHPDQETADPTNVTSTMDVERAVRCQYPASTTDLIEIVRQAYENHLTVKHTYGRFPVGTEPADVLVSLEKLARLLSYDPLTQTVTVEPGIPLSELFLRLEHYDLTLDLPGWVVDMSVGDAMVTGLPSFAQVVERCSVLLPGGETRRLAWQQDTVPSMQGVVCGLGAMCVVTTATLRCVPNRRARESASVVKVSALLALGANAGVRAHWFPLSDWCVAVRTSEVRLRSSTPAPLWVRVASAALAVFQRTLRLFTAPLVWHFPALACLASSAQLAVCSASASLRDGHCFPAHALASPRRHCAGIQWVVDAGNAARLIEAVGEWARRNPRHVSTPARLSWHGPLEGHRRPLLDPGPAPLPGNPGNDDNGLAASALVAAPPRPAPTGLVLWLDWFGPAALEHGTCLPMAGLEAAIQECGATKCWSAGPAHASALIAAGYHGYRRWQRERRKVDPGASFVSAYVIGDIAGTNSRR